ncbi:MAG: tRNA (adenosine(37)-N6)-dimethylallyltransferase MiaA [bacterium]
MKPGVLFIVGPTGVGKTELSLELANLMNAEIVSADSRQVYKYMDIGTAKPSKAQLARVPHHFIDIVCPDEYYSAGRFGREARKCIDDVVGRGRQPIVVGGSGLYIRALVRGLFEPQIADAEVKKELARQARNHGLETLYQKLRRVDSATAERLNPTDTQRILRALEVYEITGRPFSFFRKLKTTPANFRPLFWGLTMERSRLYARIEARVDRMLAAGFLQEVEDLRARGYEPHLNALKTVGYKEANQFLDKQIDCAEMVAQFKQKTRNYAKRQMTWFRNERDIRWLEVTDEQNLIALAQEIGAAADGKRLKTT